MPIAYLNLRHNVPERIAAFTSGLQECGYRVVHSLPGHKFERGDILVTWNRIYEGDEAARRFEAVGNTVLVTENATWGNGFAEQRWYTIARSFHNQAGRFRYGGPQRWDALDIALAPWRTDGETVILAQRGIGPPSMRQPPQWAERMRQRPSTQARIRYHPGQRKDVMPLEQDLANAQQVITWGSGAAVLACMWGIRVTSYLPNWIGEQDNTDAGRLHMLRRLAWAQWRLDEIASGAAFEHLMGSPRASDEAESA
jgi:hypothetical protein